MEPEAPIIAKTSIGGDIALTREERKRHVYIVGKSGSGKSTVLFNLAMHDILAGEGVCVIDPHGDLAEAIIDALPPSRTHEVCYLNVADTEFPVGFNPLAHVRPERHALAAAGIVSTFKHLWGDSWGPRLEHFLFNGVAALLAAPRPTLMDLARIYTDSKFRAQLIPRITDPVVDRFWTQEFPSYDQRFQSEAAAPILNKVGQFAASPTLRNILGQVSPKFDLSCAMDEQRILIANLSKGQVGESASNLIGSLLLSHLQLAAMRRSDLTPEKRMPVFVHIDEFQSFSTEAFAALLSEARKFSTHFSLANQFTEQLTPTVRAAVLGNAGTLIVFRVSATDAELLAPEFHPLPAPELADQSPYLAWLRRSNSERRLAFIEPPLFPSLNRRKSVIAQSRRNFGRRRLIIEKTFTVEKGVGV
ncbi:MAG TPA: type IV secretory system conjugative DNA transfer family protein [Pseudolabrys sp.]|jgi:RecA/RadA recombinase